MRNPIPEKIKNMISKGMVSKTKRSPSKKDSYGLGLYVVKHIEDDHDGKIKLESNEKSGTTFIIILSKH